MKVKLLLVVLLIGVISNVQSISPPHRAPCDKCGYEKPTKCPGKLVCQPGETLVDRPPFCEPTCCDDCSGTKPFPIGYLVKPTCICKPGLVRHNGVCIEPCQCPSKQEEPPVKTPKSCGSDDVPYQNQPGGCQTCNSIPPVKPPCGCPQSAPNPCPCQVTALPCPCQGAPAVGCPAPCYPPPPVAPPNPCGSCGRTV